MEGTGMLNGNAVRQEGRKLWQYLSACSACLLAVGAGTALAWTSPVLLKLKEKDSWLPITEEQGSWIGSFLAIGAMLGALPAGSAADKLGRKVALLLLSVPYLVSWTIIALAGSVWVLCLARFIVGVGVGATCVLVPSYVAEIAEPSARGTLGAMFQLLISIGIVLTFVTGYVLSYTGLAIVCGVVEVLFLATFSWMPESPVWLVGQGRKLDAAEALKVLRGGAFDAAGELAGIQKDVDEQSKRRSTILDLVKTPGSRRALQASFGGMIFQQLSGINAVIFYTAIIFQAAGSSLKPDIAAIVVALVQMVMSAVAALIVDKAGRKPLLMFSSSVMACSLFALGLYFKLQRDGTDVSNLGWLPLSSLTLFMIAFSVGMGPIPWMLAGELFTVETKAVASGVAVMLNWFLVFLVTKAFPTMQETLGEAVTFWIFAGFMVAATAFAYFIVPETKGRTLQAIQDKLNRTRGNRPA
ncbi:facilitated trehalose transporter Tret1 [Orussus abietinus]|uniref:facilitated trehalose transporter Tret1 n=1 Tax=Orussus abietinus TaxID=222816 RepID=UPI0006268583|nr:facilitated trehalose transporter Tret1 [Orussus abietinus]